MFNLKNVSAVAAASALVIAGQPAYAIDTTAASFELNIGGASAFSGALRSAVIDQLCVDGTIDVFMDIASGAAGGTPSVIDSDDHWTVACDLLPGLVTGGFTSVAISKEDDGGSFDGTVPVQLKLTEPFLNASFATCGAAFAVGETSPLGKSFDVYSCGVGTLAPEVPDAGISDVEPTRFIFPGNNPSDPEFDVANNPPGWTQAELGILGFGVNASLPLYRAMQICQGLDITDDESPANMPTISYPAVASIYLGEINTWDTVFDCGGIPFVDYVNGADNILGTADDGDDRTCTIGGSPAPCDLDGTAGLPVTALSSSAPFTAPISPAVGVCRRSTGSGTHLQTQIEFLGSTCGTTVQIGTISNPVTGPVIYGVSSSGNMDRCLDANGGGVNSGVYVANRPAFGDGFAGAPIGAGWAIGYQSMEKNEDMALAYRFLKLDGDNPSMTNIHSGAYTDAYITSYQYRANDYNGTCTAADCEATANAINAALIAGTSTDVNIGLLNDEYEDPLVTTDLREGAFMALPTSTGVTVDATYAIANPVSPFDRDGNSCGPLNGGDSIEIGD